MDKVWPVCSIFGYFYFTNYSISYNCNLSCDIKGLLYIFRFVKYSSILYIFRNSSEFQSDGLTYTSYIYKYISSSIRIRRSHHAFSTTTQLKIEISFRNFPYTHAHIHLHYNIVLILCTGKSALSTGSEGLIFPYTLEIVCLHAQCIIKWYKLMKIQKRKTFHL